MSNCVETIITENLEFCADNEVVAGISPVAIYACPVKDFTEIQKPKALNVAVSLEEAGTIDGSHTFTAPKGFFKIDILPDTGLVESANEGEKGAKSNTNSFSGTLAGTDAKKVGFIRKYQNQPMIFIVTENDGTKKQIGSEVSPAYMSEGSQNSGQKAGDVKGTVVKFTDVQAYPAPVYTGTITEFTPA